MSVGSEEIEQKLLYIFLEVINSCKIYIDLFSEVNLANYACFFVLYNPQKVFYAFYHLQNKFYLYHIILTLIKIF